jgi:hypothetical protein
MYVRMCLCMYVCLSRCQDNTSLTDTPFFLRTTVVALGCQGRNTETRLKQAAQIVGQFCTAVTGKFSCSNYHMTRFLLPDIRAKPNEFKIISNVEISL